jgi:hypothetical protein
MMQACRAVRRRLAARAFPRVEAQLMMVTADRQGQKVPGYRICIIPDYSILRKPVSYYQCKSAFTSKG